MFAYTEFTDMEKSLTEKEREGKRRAETSPPQKKN
jgi:hypothetical protein